MQIPYFTERNYWKERFSLKWRQGDEYNFNEVETTVMVIIFWDFLGFYQMSLSPQVKWSVIISNQYGIYELPHELSNDLRIRILGIRKYQENLKTW